MNNEQTMRIGSKPLNKPVAVLMLAILAVACSKPKDDQKDLRNFRQVNLVANSPEYHPVTVDPTLLNAFGMAWSSNGVAWVNSVGGHVSELYSSEGAIARTPVNIPAPGAIAGGLPCGIVFSGGKGFNLANGPSQFLFTGFDGVLAGWNGASGNNAIGLKRVHNANYTGLAMGSSKGRNLIYGANYGASKIDVWDTSFSPVAMSFKDPSLPAGYSPYNIQAVGDKLFVLYAELNFADGVPGHNGGTGKGFVSVFNTDGSFMKRFASRGTLDIPWGVTMAPASFLKGKDLDISATQIPDNMHGKTYTGAGNAGEYEITEPVILIGNFGDGRINVFSQDAKYLGQLQSHNHPVVIDGLWALSFAPSAATGIDPNRLYFTAGPDKESDGLFGYLIKQ